MSQEIIPHDDTIFDLHCDTLVRAAISRFEDGSMILPEHNAPMRDLEDTPFHIDLTRLSAFPHIQSFAIFCHDSVPYTEIDRFMDHMFTRYREQLAKHPDLFVPVRTMAEMDEALASRRTASLLTIENGRVLGTGIANVERYAEEGVRMMTLTWNAPNPIGSGNETSDGLTTYGREAIRTLEEHDIVVDVSHLNGHGFRDLLDIARRPFIATHSNARAVHDHPRNLTDYQIEAIIDRGGLIGLTFCTIFISGSPDPTPDELLRHIDHILSLGGEKNLAIGSDFDGADVPSWLSSVSDIPTFRDRVRSEFGAEIANDIFVHNAYRFFGDFDLRRHT